MVDQVERETKKVIGREASKSGKVELTVAVPYADERMHFRLSLPGILHVNTAFKLLGRIHKKLAPGAGCTPRTWGIEWTQRQCRVKSGYTENMQDAASGTLHEFMHHDLVYLDSVTQHYKVADLKGAQTIPLIKRWLARGDDLTLYVYRRYWRRRGLLGRLMPQSVDVNYSLIRRSRLTYPPAIEVGTNSGYPGRIDDDDSILEALRVLADWSKDQGRELTWPSSRPGGIRVSLD